MTDPSQWAHLAASRSVDSAGLDLTVWSGLPVAPHSAVHQLDMKYAELRVHEADGDHGD